MTATPITTWCSAIVDDFLLSRLLVAGPIRNPQQELKLSQMRRRALLSRGVPLGTLTNLAMQCFLNEFSWREDETEAACVAALLDRIASGDRDPTTILKVACYRPLAELPSAQDLLAQSWPAPVAEVLNLQVATVIEERRRAAEVQSLTPIREGVSQEVLSLIHI